MTKEYPAGSSFTGASPPFQDWMMLTVLPLRSCGASHVGSPPANSYGGSFMRSDQSAPFGWLLTCLQATMQVLQPMQSVAS